MMRDIPNGIGLWVHGGTHIINFDSLLTVFDETERFLDALSPNQAPARNFLHTVACRLLKIVFYPTRRPTTLMIAPKSKL